MVEKRDKELKFVTSARETEKQNGTIAHISIVSI